MMNIFAVLQFCNFRSVSSDAVLDEWVSQQPGSESFRACLRSCLKMYQELGCNYLEPFDVLNEAELKQLDRDLRLCGMDGLVNDNTVSHWKTPTGCPQLSECLMP